MILKIRVAILNLFVPVLLSGYTMQKIIAAPRAIWSHFDELKFENSLTTITN